MPSLDRNNFAKVTIDGTDGSSITRAGRLNCLDVLPMKSERREREKVVFSKVLDDVTKSIIAEA